MGNLKECRWSHVSSRLTTWSPGPDIHFGRSLQPDNREQESRDSSSHKSCSVSCDKIMVVSHNSKKNGHFGRQDLDSVTNVFQPTGGDIHKERP